METKICSSCGEAKPDTVEFWYFRAGRGRQTPCRECRKALSRAQYAMHGESIRARLRQARLDDAERARETARINYWTNRERKLAIARKARNSNREQKRARDRDRVRPTRDANRLELAAWYARGCVVCGLVFMPGGMHAHHRDPSEKDQAASQLLNARAGSLPSELEKCDPFCASHHGMLEQAKRDCNGTIPYEELVAILRD